MKVHARGLKTAFLSLILIAVIISSFAPSFVGAARAASVSVEIPQPQLVINEFSSYGTSGSEWVEIYNNGTGDARYTDLHLTDQDGHDVNISSAISDIPAGDYLLIRFGKGVNDTDFTDGNATIYARMVGDVLNDDGDDLLLYNGTYGTSDCQYLDYIAYYNGGKDADLDQPPIGSGIKFKLDGIGYYHYIPAPGPHESVSLVPNGWDENRAGNWYITRDVEVGIGSNIRAETPGLQNSNILLVNVTDIAPVNQTQGTERAILTYTATAIGLPRNGIGYINILTVPLELNGTLKNSYIESAYLYMDTNHNGKWDPGDGGSIDSATFSGGKGWFIKVNTHVNLDQTERFFITVNITRDASVFENYSLKMDDMDTGTVVGAYTDEVYIVGHTQSKYIRISPIDQTPPYVLNATFDVSHPLGPGEHGVTIKFDEPMLSNVTPLVTYGVYGYEYVINGSWVNSTVWHGNFTVSPQGPEGPLILEVSKARDMYYNEMIPYSRDFYVDISRPFVANISMNVAPPYPAATIVNLTLTFTEPVTGLMAKIVGEHKEFIVDDIYNENNTIYSLKFNTMMLKTGYYKLVVYGARDIAGNVMYDYYYNFSVDSSVPIITYVGYPGSVVEGHNVTFSVYATDNVGVARVWAVYEYNGQEMTVEATRVGDHWEFQVVGGAVKPDTVTVDIYVQDYAGNIFKDEETFSVIPWWHAMWWLWVILAIIFGFILFLLYDVVRRSRLRAQLGEDMVSDPLIVRFAHKFKREKKPKKSKKKKKKSKHEEEEEEEYTPPPVSRDLPIAPETERTPSYGKSNVPEVPYGEDEYFNEETVEREE